MFCFVTVDNSLARFFRFAIMYISERETHKTLTFENTMEKKNCKDCGIESNRGSTCEGTKLCKLRCYVKAVEARLAKTYAGSETANPKVEIREGSKNWKIVSTVYGQTSVHSFVNRETGDVMKPASWNAPAKHPRGNIFSTLFGAEALSDYGINYLK